MSFVNLYLTPVDSEGRIIWNSENDSQNVNFSSYTDSISIWKLKINASIFSPPVVDVYCQGDVLKLNKSVSLHSTFGIVMAEIGTQETDSEQEIENHLICLISNREDVFTQFVIVKIKVGSDEYGDNSLHITLMEKHALFLALTHSFACIAHTPSYVPSVSKGRLSIAEIVEKLSTIHEDGRTSGENEESEQKSIFNFESSTLHAYKDKNERNCTQMISYSSYSYAFLSRFVAPASQSRLQIILSLMFKYGYGFVYRPIDEQYLAIDLLSMIAPGYMPGVIVNGHISSRGWETYRDRVIFTGQQSHEYFQTYACEYMYADSAYSNAIARFNKQTKNVNNVEFMHFFSHNFESFYGLRILCNQNSLGLKRVHFSASGSRDYCYLSRYTPLASSSRPLQGGGNFGFDLSYLSKVPSSINKSDITELFSSSNGNLESVFFQNDYHRQQDGSSACRFEDEIEINDDISGKRKCGIDMDIETVNQRLAYARYKLDYMQKNYIEQVFEFNDNNGMSRFFNITYELFNWLGFHTDIFNTIANFYNFSVQKNNPPKSSGATHSISSVFANKGNYHQNLHGLADVSDGDYDFLYGFKDKESSSLFGGLNIEISAKNEDDGYTYDLVSKLVFYNDMTNYNIDPYSWKSKNEAYDKSQQNEKINNKGNNEQEQGLEQEENKSEQEQGAEQEENESKQEQDEEQEENKYKKAKQGLENAIGLGIIPEGDESDNEEDEKSSNRPSRPMSSQNLIRRRRSRPPVRRNNQAFRLPGGNSAVNLFNDSLFSLGSIDPDSPAGIVHKSMMFNNSALENADEDDSQDIDDLVEGGRRLSKDPQ